MAIQLLDNVAILEAVYRVVKAPDVTDAARRPDARACAAPAALDGHGSRCGPRLCGGAAAGGGRAGRDGRAAGVRPRVGTGGDGDGRAAQAATGGRPWVGTGGLPPDRGGTSPAGGNARAPAGDQGNQWSRP
jgi:hypothetical protein